MMDKAIQDSKVNIKEVLLQRDQERKDKLKNLKDEKELTAPDQVKSFHVSFDEHSLSISENIKLIEDKKIQPKDLPEHFSKISKDLQLLNKFLSVSTMFLTNYSVRICLKTLEDFEAKIKELEAEFLPKKKFGFKSRKQKPLEKPCKAVADELDSSSPPKEMPLSLQTVMCGFCDRSDEKLIMSQKEIEKNDVEMRNLKNCEVTLLGNASTIHITNATKCKLISGPVSTSVFVENCEDCDFVIACQQLRIHSTSNSRFYIHVTSKAIIEDSSNVAFAPYNLHYELIDQHFEASGLEKSQNNWNKVDDFNWLASDVPSPHWNEICESDRVTNWLDC